MKEEVKKNVNDKVHMVFHMCLYTYEIENMRIFLHSCLAHIHNTSKIIQQQQQI